MEQFIDPHSYGAKGNGKSDDTQAMQKAIDAAALVRGTVRVEAGVYIVGSLFLKSHVTLELQKNAVLLGTSNETKYVVVDSRVAGIEMPWPAGILNVINVKNVRVTGEGTVDGNGPVWWNKYWGADGHSGMRAEYVSKGMRWCLDYDCRRIRNIVVQNAENVEILGIESIRSGFWNIQLTYCKNVHVGYVRVHDNSGPSTDGIVVDSSNGVIIDHCVVDCNDDDIAIKAGRDWDGLKVGRPCENVQIQNCEIQQGSGVTLGSETSGGIRNINIRDMKYRGTANALRIKSSNTRGGVIERIQFSNIEAVNVTTVFNFDLDWYPDYNRAVLPKEYENKPIPPHWEKLLSYVPVEVGIPEVKGLYIHDVKTEITGNYAGSAQAFYVNAYAKLPIRDVTFQNVQIHANEYGVISNITNWSMDNMHFTFGSPK